MHECFFQSRAVSSTFIVEQREKFLVSAGKATRLAWALGLLSAGSALVPTSVQEHHTPGQQRALSGVATKPAVLEEIICPLKGKYKSKLASSVEVKTAMGWEPWVMGKDSSSHWLPKPSWARSCISSSLVQAGMLLLVGGAVFPAGCWLQAPAPQGGCGHSTPKQELDPSCACLNICLRPSHPCQGVVERRVCLVRKRGRMGRG